MTDIKDGHDPTEAAGPRAPSLGLPARLDMRRAFDIYVFGRNRTLAPEQKRDVVGGEVSEPFTAPPKDDSPVPSVERAEVQVPAELSFERNAGTWRDRGSRSGEGAR